MQYKLPAPKWQFMEQKTHTNTIIPSATMSAPKAKLYGANVELQRTILELHKRLDEELEKLRKIRNEHLN